MNFFRQVKDSFTNFDAYREISEQRGGKTFRYFILLFTLVFLIGGLGFAYNFKAGTAEFATVVREQVPEFNFANGELILEGPQPIVFDGDNNSTLIIDTTGQVDESALNEYSEGVFISKEKLVNKQGPKTTEFNFADFSEISFDKQKLLGYMPMLKWLLPIMAVFGYILKMVWVLVTVVILALIGLIINSARKGKLEFGNTWNMAIYAFTLPWLLEMVKNLVYPAMPIFWVVKWGIAVFILYKGIEAATKPVITDEAPPAEML